MRQVQGAFEEIRRLKAPLYNLAGGKEAIFHYLCGPEIKTPYWAFRNTRFCPDRAQMLALLPQDGVVCEVGTLHGDYARQIFDINKPRKLYTIDVDYSRFRFDWFKAETASGRLETRTGLSWDVLATFDDCTFDWIYIDAGHDYESVMRDARIALRKMKPNGYLVFNDFTVWSVAEFLPYGVARAVMELAAQERLEVTHFALNLLGYNDVALRRLP
jgi:predicted O-methyltransferase YrrM